MSLIYCICCLLLKNGPRPGYIFIRMPFSTQCLPHLISISYCLSNSRYFSSACRSSDKLLLNTSFNSWVKFLSNKFSKVFLLSTLVSSKLLLTSSSLALKNSVFISESVLYLQFDYFYCYCFLVTVLPC